MSSANLTRPETAARSAGLTVHDIRVELDVRDAPEASVVTFPTTVTLRFDATLDATWVDFIGASVQSVELNGRSVPVRYDGARIAVDELAASNTLVIAATAFYSRSGEGMHRFVDPVDGETYLYTHYEPADARRVFPCFEQPDLKAPYLFTVHAPERWTVVSNQAVADRESRDGVQTVTFERTLPLPSYITAVAAGPYHREHSEFNIDGTTVPLSVLCRASLAEHLEADEIFEVTRAGLRFFCEQFDYPYPWGTYDQLFVPEFNIGAMENPGCVTFSEHYVFRGASTAAQHESRATTILHEMAHMWFGDLVTMRWWDDLWLKESFADFMGSLATAEVTTWPDAWVTFANRRKAWAYLQDQLPTTHPVVADIPDLEAAKLNFDGITYAKGASVLKQLVAYVGREAFFAGARRYFRAHEFGNTTLDDLLVALEQASGRDLRSWAAAWLQTTGVTTLRLERRTAGEHGAEGQDAASRDAAIVPSDDRPHRIAVGWYDRDQAGDIVRMRREELDVAGSPVPIGDDGAAIVLVNDDDLSYAKVRLDESSLEAVERSLSRVVDPLPRGLIWSALWNATRDGELPVGRYLDVVCAHAASETNLGLLTAVLGNAVFAVEHYVPVAGRQHAHRAWLTHAWDELLNAEPGSGAQLAWARAVAEAAAFDDSRSAQLAAMLVDEGAAPAGLPLDPELRWRFWSALSATGHAEEADLNAELRRDDSAASRIAHRRALAARPTEAVKRQAWQAALTDLALTNDELDATIEGFTEGDHRRLTDRYDDAYFAALTEVWATRSIELAERIVVGLFPRSESLDAVDDWLHRNAQAPAALRRLVTERRDHLARDLRVCAANATLPDGRAARVMVPSVTS